MGSDSNSTRSHRLICHATLAGACLLTAAALRELLAGRANALVTVDVDLSTLTSVARSLGTVDR